MDLGCLDMGCIERRSGELSPDNESSSSTSNGSSSDSLMATFKIGKDKAMKDAGQSSLSTLNKCTSQIKKPPRRKTSPLNWFPRKKVDSYLKRKIQSLQEVDGMNSTLDETLGDSNLHYSKVLKEKIAVREAAAEAMEARKAAMVEASWCKILHAARIECKDAETRLQEAEKIASDAFEAATSIGVIMYDTADCPRKYYRIETSAAKGGSTHAVSASFETAFEVDRQVAYAVKVAFTKLANYSSLNKDEFRELLRRISQNPDSHEIFQEFTSSECESDTGSEIEMGLNEDSLNDKKDLSGVRQMRLPSQASEKFNTSSLVEMMLERLKGLHEDELASLATIVATCGLNAALAEREGHKQYESDPNLQVEIGLLGSSSTDGGQTKRGVAAETELPSLDKFLVKRLTRLEREVLEAKNTQKNEARDENQPKLDNSELPSLDKFLVKRLTRLEREVLEAKNTQKNEARDENQQKFEKYEKSNHVENESSDTCATLFKHSSKLESETAEARRKNEIAFKTNSNKPVKRANPEAEMPSLDRFLIKHVSRLEKEVLEAKNRRIHEGDSVLKTKKSISAALDRTGEVSSAHSDATQQGKENIDQNKKSGDGEVAQEEGNTLTLLQDYGSTEFLTGEVIQKEAKGLPQGDENCQNNRDNTKEFPLRSSSSYQKKYLRCGGGNGSISCESLDKVLVKHVSRLEKEKMKFHANSKMIVKMKPKETNKELDKSGEESMDQILVKHKNRLEGEKLAAAAEQPEDHINHSLTRREAREKELQEAWGGLNLGNSIRPHISKLQRDKISSGDQIRHSSVRKEAREKELQEAWGGLSLGNSIKPHVSKLEMHKTSSEDQIVRHSSSVHKESREKVLQDSWGGLSLGNSIRPHLSRLERDKAAWLKAEEEERRRAVEDKLNQNVCLH